MRLTHPVIATRYSRPSLVRSSGAVVLAAISVGGCSGDGGGPIEDNLIRPGITAMNDATVLACNADRAALTMALETFDIMQGDPASDQTALVEAGYLREPSALYDVVDGQIVAINPDCA